MIRKETDKFWWVISVTDKPCVSGSPVPVYHSSHTKAKARAHEVSRANPGVPVYILEATSVVTTPVGETTRQALDFPQLDQEFGTRQSDR